MSLNRTKLTSRFQEEYQKLNDRQKRAVDTIEGPVMVIAGPGTGKTQILASRIGKILLETDVLPENILCLTYTDAGVVAMRKRLLNFIGPDAYKVNIVTFHSFCNEVIQENLSLFEKTAMDPVSDLEKAAFFKELIDSFPKNHRLKKYRGDVYFEVNSLDRLFSDMKREGWTPAFINQRIDDYITDLPNREEFIYKRKYKNFNAGDLKKDRIEEEVEKMEKLRAAVNEFDRFQDIMRRHNRYDFDDMINWVIRAFETNKNLLSNYQERYQYILVDEYQDTSGTQNRIVELLISYWEAPNIFVVGDDDQSIYRFQGANVANMKDFADGFQEHLHTVVLTSNYRSTQPILDLSSALINRNEERLVKKIPGLSKELVASNQKVAGLTHKPEIREYEKQRDEMIDLTLQIQRLVSEGTEPGRIGVIYKENKYGEELAEYLRLRKIPVYTKRSINIFELPLAQKIILVLNYLAAEHDTPYGGDEMLFELLHVNWFGIPAIDIAKLSVEVANRKFTDNKTSLRELVHEKSTQPPKDLFSVTIHDNLRRAGQVLENLIADVPNLTLQQLFEKIIRETGLLRQIMQSDDKHRQMQVLTGLFDFVKEETRRNPFLTLQELVNVIDLMTREDIVLPLVEVSGSEKGVNLMTVHGSKGLEFGHVFVAGVNAAFWEKKRKPGGGYKLPDTVFSAPAKQSDDEELRRLFYVALTRAEEHLTISYCRFRNDGKEQEPSMFISEIRDVHDIPIEKIFVDNDVASEFALLRFETEWAPEIENTEAEFVDRALEKFVMNVTALNNYLKCPLEFYFKNLVRIPSPKNEATEFGSSVHYALEQLFRKMKEDPNEAFPGKEVFIHDFEWYMQRHRESFTREQFDRRMEYGQEVLNNYYDTYIESWNKIVAIETNIRNVLLKGIPLKGKLDKLEFDGKSVNVVDYKTGDPDKGREKLKRPGDKNPLGGDYWRQAVFYKILVDNYRSRDWKATSSEFDFIEPDKKKQYKKEKILITPADIASVTQQIVDTWEKIQAREFYTGCGKNDCHWCRFVKTHELAVALHEVQNEEEPSED